MNELIEYFKKMEARLAALEEAQKNFAPKDKMIHAEDLESVSEQISALLTSLSKIEETLNNLIEAQAETDARIDALESRVEFDIPEEDEDYEEEEPEEEEELEEEEEEPLLPIAEPEEEEETPKPAPAAEPEPAPHSVVPKVTDIKKAISLGDRFLFQRELFGGNGELMAKTIAELNKLNSLDDADAFITKHFAWDKESSTYELFYSILKRRW